MIWPDGPVRERGGMKTVGDVLKEKGRAVWTIAPQATAYEALTLMAERNVGAVLVMESGKLVGILSERDCVRKLDIKGRSPASTKVSEIMTETVVYVRPEQSMEECMGLMTSRRFRHLPVLDGEALVGVVSIGDVVKAVIADQGFLIEQLTNYITGKGR
jgi:CBS domain-containing protein